MEMLISLLPGSETKPTSRVLSHKKQTIKLTVFFSMAEFHDFSSSDSGRTFPTLEEI